MTDSIQSQLVADLARDVVAEIAPQELPMFRAQSRAYFEDPEGALRGQAAKDEMLGFGAGTVATFLTPAVLALATTVVSFVAAAVKESVQEGAKDLLSDVVKGMFKKFRPEQKEELPSLTPEQLRTVRELVFKRALELRLSERTAHTLANSLVGSLVVSP